MHHNVERSYESLQKEVIKLQEVLKDREDEIRSLEVSIREIRRMSDSITPPLASTPAEDNTDELRNQDQPNRKAGPSSTRLSAESAHLAGGATSIIPNVTRSQVDDPIDQDTLVQSDQVLAAIQSQILLNNGDESVVKDSQNIKLLDNLMRSMAQKESAHLELIESLKDKLQTTKRQHDELVKLSRDQVVNMSSEIEALRQKLSCPPTPTPDPEMSNRLAKLQELLQLKQHESENLKAESTRQLLDLEVKLLEAKQGEVEALKAEHDSVVEQLKLEQRENLNRLIASSEEKLLVKQDELRQLEERWQSQSEADLAAQAEKIRAEFEQEQQELLESRSREQELALQEQQSRFDTETHQLLDQHAQSMEQIQEELNQQMKRIEAQHKAQVEELQSSHASEVMRLTTSLSSRGKQGSSTMETLIESHYEELEGLRVSLENQLEEQRTKLEAEKSELVSQHEERIKAMEASHETQIAEVKAEHEEVLVASLTELDLRRTRKFESNLAALQEKHQAEIDEIKLHHQRQIEALSSSQSDLMNSATLTNNPRALDSKIGAQNDIITSHSDVSEFTQVSIHGEVYIY
jgi:kinesin family protein 4/21/27